MSRISAICLSDLHFGYWGSVLTATNGRRDADLDNVSPVLEQLVRCMAAVLSNHENEPKPKLVLAGDVLELSLATTNVAASVFAQFLDLLLQNGDLPFDRSIVCLPGNHDHHLWELAREQQYAGYLHEADTVRPFKNIPWHATHLFPWRETLNVPNRNVENLLLNTIAEKVEGTRPEGRTRFLSMYPNYGMLGADGQRCTVVHHGHFTESIYYLMTELRSIVFPGRPLPREIWDIEVENFAWIDFLWGTLGRSGGVGEDVEQIYEELRTKAGRERLVDRVAKGILDRLNLCWLKRLFAIYCIKRLLTGVVQRLTEMERGVQDGPLSGKSRDLLEKYIACYTERQLNRERKEERGERMPEHLNFIFGHTHKPFEEVLDATKFNRPVHVYNSGGWVVDGTEPDCRKGGAMVVVDDQGNAASIQMYSEAADATSYAVEVRQAGDENPLSARLRALVKPKEPPWSTFSAAVATAVKERQDILKTNADC